MIMQQWWLKVGLRESVGLCEIHKFQAHKAQSFHLEVVVFNISCIWRGKKQKSRYFGEIAKNRDKSRSRQIDILNNDASNAHVSDLCGLW